MIKILYKGQWHYVYEELKDGIYTTVEGLAIDCTTIMGLAVWKPLPLVNRPHATILDTLNDNGQWEIHFDYTRNR